MRSSPATSTAASSSTAAAPSTWSPTASCARSTEPSCGDAVVVTTLVCGDRRLLLGSRTFVMGIVNVTPDSFSDGGQFHGIDDAVAHAVALVDAGADIVDVGGESTKPGAAVVDVETERARVLPVIEA